MDNAEIKQKINELTLTLLNDLSPIETDLILAQIVGLQKQLAT